MASAEDELLDLSKTSHCARKVVHISYDLLIVGSIILVPITRLLWHFDPPAGLLILSTLRTEIAASVPSFSAQVFAASES